MFCDGCGAALEPGQTFCSRCGKQVVGVIVPLSYVRSRVEEHVQLVGILWLGFSAFNLIGAIVLFALANTLLAPGGPANAPEWLHIFLTAIAFILTGKSFLGFIGGWGLTARESWGRVLVLALAFVSLFTNIPFGTALGIYTLWVLLPRRSQEEYEALVTAKAA